MSLTYERALEPLHFSVKQLCWQISCSCRVVNSTFIDDNLPNPSRTGSIYLAAAYGPPPSCLLHLEPYTLHLKFYTLLREPCTLHPTLYTFPAPGNLHSTTGTRPDKEQMIFNEQQMMNGIE